MGDPSAACGEAEAGEPEEAAVGLEDAKDNSQSLCLGDSPPGDPWIWLPWILGFLFETGSWTSRELGLQACEAMPDHLTASCLCPPGEI